MDFDGANALDHAEVALLLDLADTRKLSRQLLVALGERAAKQVVHFNGRPVEIDWVERPTSYDFLRELRALPHQEREKMQAFAWKGKQRGKDQRPEVAKDEL